MKALFSLALFFALLNIVHFFFFLKHKHVSFYENYEVIAFFLHCFFIPNNEVYISYFPPS